MTTITLLESLGGELLTVILYDCPVLFEDRLV
jgi:hypothetical protein